MVSFLELLVTDGVMGLGYIYSSSLAKARCHRMLRSSLKGLPVAERRGRLVRSGWLLPYLRGPSNPKSGRET